MNTASKAPDDAKTAINKWILDIITDILAVLKNIHEMQLCIYRMQTNLDKRFEQIEKGLGEKK